MKLNFPNWGYLHYALIDDYKRINPNINIKHCVSQYNRLDKAVQNGKNTLEISYQLLSNLRSEINNNKNTFTASKYNRKINNPSFSPNEFVTVLNIIKGEYEFVDPKIESIFGIPAKKFNLNSQLGLNPGQKLYHPEDLMHLLKYVNIAYLLSSLGGLKYDYKSDYCRLIYRIKIPNSTGKHKTFLVNRRSFIAESDTNKNELPLTRHLDYWTIIEPSSFTNVAVEFISPDNLDKSKFLHSLAFLYNARLMNFSVKEILVIQLLNQTSGAIEISENINQLICKHHNKINANVTPKQISDLTYRLKLKLKNIYENHILKNEMSALEFETIKSHNSFQRMKRLGLVDLSSQFLDFIIKHLEFEND